MAFLQNRLMFEHAHGAKGTCDLPFIKREVIAACSNASIPKSNQHVSHCPSRVVLDRERSNSSSVDSQLLIENAATSSVRENRA